MVFKLGAGSFAGSVGWAEEAGLVDGPGTENRATLNAVSRP